MIGGNKAANAHPSTPPIPLQQPTNPRTHRMGLPRMHTSMVPTLSQKTPRNSTPRSRTALEKPQTILQLQRNRLRTHKKRKQNSRLQMPMRTQTPTKKAANQLRSIKTQKGGDGNWTKNRNNSRHQTRTKKKRLLQKNHPKNH